MSRTSAILNRALREKQGVTGEIIVEDIRQTGLNKAQVESWVRRLRKAADTLEELIK